MDVDIKITEDILFEQQLIAYLTEFMDKHGYKINFSSICTSGEVSIVGESGYVGLEDFYFELKKTDFLKKFGIRGYTLFEKIFKPWICILPTNKRPEMVPEMVPENYKGLHGRYSVAAKTGDLEALKKFRVDGCPLDKWTCAGAAQGGHLEVLQWARAEGCPWDELTCVGAASNGHLEVLQWACGEGCPWDETTCRMAKKNGHLQVLEWAISHGCPEW